MGEGGYVLQRLTGLSVVSCRDGVTGAVTRQLLLLCSRYLARRLTQLVLAMMSGWLAGRMLLHGHWLCLDIVAGR